MKTIETLVEDIYDLFNLTPIDMDEAEVDKHIDTFGEMLKVHLKSFLYEVPRDRGNLRLSAIGKPDRKLWYDVNKKLTPETLPPSTRIKFLYGYILEELLLLCATVAGHDVTDQQKEVTLEGVVGHQDSIIDGVLVDVKSASGMGFDKFKYNKLTEDDPFGYVAQVSAYAAANGLDRAAFLAINKSTGEVCLSQLHSMDMINAKERIKHLKECGCCCTPYLISAIPIYLMVSLATVSLLLVVFIVSIRETVGRMLMAVRGYVRSSIRRVGGILRR